MTITRWILAWSTVLTLCASAIAADPTGKWTAKFDTQIGVQNYVFEFQANGEVLTGTASSEIGGKSEIHDGKFVDDTLSFIEGFKFEDMDIPITYTGKLSGDEIHFTRNVGEFATEQLVAKRVE